MKKLLSSIAILNLIFCFSFRTGDPLPIGSDMPLQELSMQNISGKNISLKEAAMENGLLVIFSCNTCPFVIKNKQRMSELTKEAQRMKFGMIVVNSNEAYREQEDSFEEMQSFAKANKLDCHYVVDKNSQVADAFGAKRTPECFLFDKNLKLVYHGAIDDNANDATAVTRHHLREAMSETAEGKEVSVKETKSIGCGIKRKA